MIPDSPRGFRIRFGLAPAKTERLRVVSREKESGSSEIIPRDVRRKRDFGYDFSERKRERERERKIDGGIKRNRNKSTRMKIEISIRAVAYFEPILIGFSIMEAA